jgi:hypothetical protein
MGRCNTLSNRRGEVYAKETKEEADEEASMVHGNGGRGDMESLARREIDERNRTGFG